MIKNLISIIKIFAYALVIQAIGTSTLLAQKKTAPLFKLGDNEFNSGEFEYYFLKNNDALVKDSVDFKVNEYLDLYVKFRLKVLEAEAKKLHLEESYQTELAGYKKQLVKPYLMESKMSEALIQEVYDRMKQEVNASHILLKVDENALPKDTLEVYNKLTRYRDDIIAGTDFDSLAQAISEDPSARSNKGNLGYFSALAMVYQFEDAAFNTEVGDVSNPVRTKFGYHLIQVKDKRKAKGKVKVAHIMLRLKKSPTQEEVSNIEIKINSIHDKLMNGEVWNELCEVYSEDHNTKNKGGVINWFGSGNLVKEFEDAAFGLENSGDISLPFQTKYGWHIVKLIDKKPIEPLEEIRGQLESKISRDGRSKVKKKQTIITLKKQNNFTLNQDNKSGLINNFDSTLLEGKWIMDSTLIENKVLFKLNETSYGYWDFSKYVAENQSRKSNTSLKQYIDYLYNQFEEKSIFDFEEKSLEKSNEDFRMILQEYRDGILLFNLMEKEVWAKAIDDSIGQTSYYNENLHKYKKKESAKIRMLVSENKEVIEKAKSFLSKSKKEIDKAFNSEEPLNLQVFDKSVDKGEDSEVDKYWSVGQFEYEKDKRFYLLQVIEILPESMQPMKSVKGQLISDYQNHLEEEWIKSLKKKYPVKITKSSLKQVIKKIENQL